MFLLKVLIKVLRRVKLNFEIRHFVKLHVYLIFNEIITKPKV